MSNEIQWWDVAFKRLISGFYQLLHFIYDQEELLDEHKKCHKKYELQKIIKGKFQKSQKGRQIISNEAFLLWTLTYLLMWLRESLLVLIKKLPVHKANISMDISNFNEVLICHTWPKKSREEHASHEPHT